MYCIDPSHLISDLATLYFTENQRLERYAASLLH